MSSSETEQKICDICCDPKNREFVTCHYCKFECCKVCLKRYILEGIGAACCMNVNCSKYFTKEFLSDTFGLSWVTIAREGSYKLYLRKDYIEKEKSKMQEAIEYMEKKKQKEKEKLEYKDATLKRDYLTEKCKVFFSRRDKIVKSFVTKIKKDFPDDYKYWSGTTVRNFYDDNIVRRFDTYKRYVFDIICDPDSFVIPTVDPADIDSGEDVVLFLRRVIDLRKEQNGLKQSPALRKSLSSFLLNIHEKLSDVKELEMIEQKIIESGHNLIKLSEENSSTKVSFIQGCPVDGCRGFIEKESFTCGICDVEICKKCRIPFSSKSVEKEEEGSQSISMESIKQKHICKPEDIETVKLIKKDSKPCPKCATSIFKISGCFGKDIPILQYNGSIKLSQDIQSGDTLVGDDGSKRKVLDVCSGIDDLYRISTDSHTLEYVVNSKHTLLLSNGEMIQEFFVGDIASSFDSKTWMAINISAKQLHHIKIDYLGKGEYFGWLLDGNHSFIGVDGTLLKNCNQIWCTQCHIAFDWRTGKIESGTIHNPHYFEFLEKNGLTPTREAPVCREDDIPMMISFMNRLATPILKKDSPKEVDQYKKKGMKLILVHHAKFSRCHDMAEQSLEREIRLRERLNETRRVKLIEMRYAYMKKEIEAVEWEERIYKNHDEIEKNNFYIEIYTSLRMILTEAYRKLYADLGEPISTFDKEKDREKYVNERQAILDKFMEYTEEVRSYFNNSILNEYKKTSRKTKTFDMIGPYWDIMKKSELDEGLRPRSFGRENLEDEYRHFFNSRINRYRPINAVPGRYPTPERIPNGEE